MATMQGNLINKQYNSPIRLYSPMAVAETLDKQKKILANGAVGIDFNNLTKPGNLANSAVLRMLEEEERSGRHQGDVYNAWIERFMEHASMKEFNVEKLRKWSVRPPKRLPWDPKETTANHDVKKPTKGLKRVAWPPPPEETFENQPSQLQEPVYSQGPQSFESYQPEEQSWTSPIRPVQPPETLHRPQEAPVSPPVFHPVRFEPPKTTVTLRPSPPLTQAPQPVYAAQPVAATFNGGERMRGDQKWPPENVKQQTAAENEARLALAKGPACRPRKVKKDYSSFFAQHALNSTYPGYRAPPGTQHYSEGTSDL